MIQKRLFLKNGLIVDEMDKRYDEFLHIHTMKKPALHFKYSGGLGRFKFFTHKCQNKTVCNFMYQITVFSLVSGSTESNFFSGFVPDCV